MAAGNTTHACSCELFQRCLSALFVLVCNEAQIKLRRSHYSTTGTNAPVRGYLFWGRKVSLHFVLRLDPHWAMVSRELLLTLTEGELLVRICFLLSIEYVRSDSARQRRPSVCALGGMRLALTASRGQLPGLAALGGFAWGRYVSASTGARAPEALEAVLEEELQGMREAGTFKVERVITTPQAATIGGLKA